MRSRAMLAGAMALGLLVAQPASGAEDYAPGEKLALFNCGRCHVVSEKNARGGIESTPSFAIIRSWPDWEDRMRAFWSLRPHPTFTQIARITPPFPDHRPPTVHPVRLTLDELQQIVDYARTIEPADLGDKVRIR